jgi:hypothetical protein
LCLPVFLGDYALARASGRAASAAEYQRDAGAHLERFHYLARWISALAGSLAAVAAAWGGALLGSRKVGIAAGLLAALSPFEFLLSTHERPWSLVFLFTALALSLSLRAMNGGARRKPLFLAGLAAGAAAGSHQTGIAALALPLAAAWFGAPGRGPFGLIPAALADALRAAAVAIVGFLVTFFIGNPYLLVYGPRGGVVGNGPGATDLSVGGQGLVLKFHFAHAGEALGGVLSIEGVVCALAVAGAALLIRRGDRRASVPLCFAVPLLAFFTAYDGSHARYLLLALPALWVLGGVALVELAARGKLGFALAAALLAIPALLTLRTAQLLLREDTRSIALAELERRIPAGSAVAIEPYGPGLRPSFESLERVAAVETRTGAVILTRRERLALDRHESGGVDLLPLERVVADPAPGSYRALAPLAKDLYPGAAGLAAVLDAAQIRYVVSVDRFPGEPRADPLASLLASRGKLLWEVDPQGNGPDPPEALLPFEPRLGAYSLLSVERPGPRIRLYELAK